MPIMKVTLQLWYAYAVFLLRDVFLTGSNNRLYKWKARTTMVISQAFLVIAAVVTTMRVSDWYWPLRDPAVFVFGCGMLGLTLFLVNSAAERRLLPQFEREFHQLSKTFKIVGRTSVILYIALSIVALLGSAAAVHAKLCSKATAPVGISVKC